MKVLICGSRTINDPAVVSRAVEQSGMTPTHIISGGARGVDRLAREYAAAGASSDRRKKSHSVASA